MGGLGLNPHYLVQVDLLLVGRGGALVSPGQRQEITDQMFQAPVFGHEVRQERVPIVETRRLVRYLEHGPHGRDGTLQLVGGISNEAALAHRG